MTPPRFNVFAPGAEKPSPAHKLPRDFFIGFVEGCYTHEKLIVREGDEQMADLTCPSRILHPPCQHGTYGLTISTP